MLNRMRRAAAALRARYFPRGRHRRASTPCPQPAPTFTAACNGPTVVRSRSCDWASHRYPLAGEENALVRPYVLTWERHAQQHRSVVIAPLSSADTRSVLLGAH
ncbi:hypothetical protein GCM10010431_70200 [Streptomyces kunmingensis]